MGSGGEKKDEKMVCFSPLAIEEKPFEKGCFPKPLFLNISNFG